MNTPRAANDGTAPPGDARRVALEALGQVLAADQRLQDVVPERARAHRLPERDRALAYELAAGVMRRLLTLDTVIAAFLTEAPHRKGPPKATPRALDPLVRQVLRLGVYQLLFCEGIPAHAAVNESVALAQTVGHRRAAGLVNAVLRSVARETEFVSGAPSADAHALFCRPGRWALFARPVLPDPRGERVAWFAAHYSYPEWLVRRWLQRYGPDETTRICLAGNEDPPVFLRPQPPTDVPALLARLAVEGVEAEASPSGRTVRLRDGSGVRDLRVLKEGLALVQDDSAAAVAPFLGVRPGERVLDLCAAPGGKTAQLAAAAGPTGHVTAVDNNPRRIRRLMENLERLGIGNVAVVEADGRALPDLGGPFDAALVDAPCSNTAVLRRRVEARWRATEAGLLELSALQFDLATSAARLLRPGGRLVYATCTLEPEEDQHVLTRLIGAVPGLAMEEERQVLPAPGAGDGTYMARLVKRPVGTA